MDEQAHRQIQIKCGNNYRVMDKRETCNELISRACHSIKWIVNSPLGRLYLNHIKQLAFHLSNVE